MRLQSAAFILPHPEKAYKGGEDAAFVLANQRVIAVADGVGGWVCAAGDGGAAVG